jgi:hypothetical protein
MFFYAMTLLGHFVTQQRLHIGNQHTVCDFLYASRPISRKKLSPYIGLQAVFKDTSVPTSEGFKDKNFYSAI